MIRKATPDDYPLFLDIQISCIKGLTNTYSGDEIQAWTDYITQQGAARYGSYKNCAFEDENGSMAGFVSWSRDQDARANIECLYTLPQFRNRGIGHLLLREAEMSFSPGTAIYIRSTLNAASFYERQGYERTGNAISRAGFSIVLLEKTL